MGISNSQRPQIQRLLVNNAISASYALTASYALNSEGGGGGGVTQIIPGTGISISPTSGVGKVTINALANGGTLSGSFTGSFSGSFIGNLSGTSSWANSSSRAISSSYASTASYVNPLIQNVLLTGSLLVTQSHISSIDYIDFQLLPTTQQPAQNEGRLFWNSDTKTLQLDLEQNFHTDLNQQLLVRIVNKTGNDLPIGTVVYISGSQGNRPGIATASWNGDQTSAATIGFTAKAINNNNNGYVITRGILDGVNTAAYSVGSSLYLSSSGQFTNIAPDAPLHEVRLGKVIVQDATNGSIYVDVMNGYELTELHDVKTTTYNDGDLLIQSGSLWINSKTLTGSYTLSGSLTTNDGISVQSLTASFVSASSITGSLFGTSSWAYSSSQAISSSYALSSSYATSASYALSASYASSSLYSDSSSYASTASYAPDYVLNSATSSFVQNDQTSSFVTNSQTSSFVQNDQTSSFITNSQTSSMSVLSSSYSLTASYALTSPGVTVFPYTGDAQITGSLSVSGSINLNGADLNALMIAYAIALG